MFYFVLFCFFFYSPSGTHSITTLFMWLLTVMFIEENIRVLQISVVVLGSLLWCWWNYSYIPVIVYLQTPNRKCHFFIEWYLFFNFSFFPRGRIPRLISLYFNVFSSMGTYRIPPVSNLLMWSQQKITVTFLRYCVQNILDWTGTSNQIK